MNYDSMNVHQLMEKAVDIGTQYGHAVWKDGCEEMDTLESALRKAVVREASVGTIAIRKDPLVGYPVIDDVVVTRGENLEEWHKYDLIPREVK